MLSRESHLQLFFFLLSLYCLLLGPIWLDSSVKVINACFISNPSVTTLPSLCSALLPGSRPCFHPFGDSIPETQYPQLLWSCSHMWLFFLGLPCWYLHAQTPSLWKFTWLSSWVLTLLTLPSLLKWSHPVSNATTFNIIYMSLTLKSIHWAPNIQRFELHIWDLCLNASRHLKRDLPESAWSHHRRKAVSLTSLHGVNAPSTPTLS